MAAQKLPGSKAFRFWMVQAETIDNREKIRHRLMQLDNSFQTLEGHNFEV